MDSSTAPRRFRLPLLSLALSMLLSALGTSIANVALPAMAHAFGASFQQVQWILLAYLLAITTVIVSVGQLGDRVGRRRLLLAGIALFTVASVLCGMAPALWLLVAARALQGLGAAIMMALATAFAATAVSKDKVGSAMGILGTMSAVGTALGPSLGGLLIARFSWPAIFFINLPLGIVTLLLAARYLPHDRETDPAQHPTTPLMPWTLCRDPILGPGLAMSALVSAVVMATLVVGPFYLSGALALDAAGVGLVMSAGPIVAALTGMPGGLLVDRFGAARMTMAGLVIMLVGCVLLATFPARLGIPVYIGPLVVVCAGYAFFQAANNTAVMTHGSPAQRGEIAGLLNLSRNLGLITGTALMGGVFAFGSTGGRADAVAAGMHLTFTVAAALVVLAMVIGLRRLFDQPAY